jgi:Na+:H+ antiporter, NhaA family
VSNGRSAPPPWHPLAWADALNQFGRTEMAGGVALVIALLAALTWANADPHSYAAVWSHMTTHSSELIPSILHTVAGDIDSGLMTIFFLAIGLEVGREVAEGSLRDRRNALLPVVAALGGMAGAAAVYAITAAVIHPRAGIAGGWGIPMATDVAFTLGAISLLGKRVPRPLRTFVLALAVADDIASVIVLAIVASHRIGVLWLVGAAAVVAVLVVVRRWVRHQWWPYVLFGLVVWYLFVRGGIAPTMAGALVGLLVPVAGGARAGRTLEGPVHALSSYVVLPLFVLANAGVTLTGLVWHSPAATSVVSSVLAARTVGKMLGITVAVVLLVRFGVCSLPERTTWRHLFGVSLLCGMGITVPLLFAHAVFAHSPVLYSGAQVGLLLGTIGAAVLGAAVLLTVPQSTAPLARTPRGSPARGTVPAAFPATGVPGTDQPSEEG